MQITKYKLANTHLTSLKKTPDFPDVLDIK